MPKHNESKNRPEEVLALIKERGWDYVLDGENYKIKTCIFCGNQRSNLEIQKGKGMYKTWCCEQGGGFYKLKKLARAEVPKGEEVQVVHYPKEEMLENHTDAANNFHGRLRSRPGYQYLKSRGFNDEAIQHFKLGCQKRNGQHWLTIPHWIEGHAVNIKYRSLPPEKKMETRRRREQGAL